MNDGDDRAAAIRALISGQPARRDGTDDFLHRACGAARKDLAASGAGISVMTADGTRAACAASSSIYEEIEDLQFLLGEGPCIDAFVSRRPVLVADLADGAIARWPVYVPVAQDGGLRAVFAFPLQVGGVRLGLLDVYRDHVGPLTSEELAQALTFADVILGTLLDRQRDAAVPSAQLAGCDDVARRAELFQAQGMVMVQLRVSIGEALVRLRAYAFAHDRPLDAVAREVVARRLRFDSDNT